MRHSMDISYYDADSNHIKDIILIKIQEMQEYYRLHINVRFGFYQINKKLLENMLSSISIAYLLGVVGIDKHNFEFILKSIETEFVNFY